MQALCAALLLQPSPFSYEQLFDRVCGLSYFGATAMCQWRAPLNGTTCAGDVRMGVAESPDKVASIVRHQYEHFCALYKPALADLARLGVLRTPAPEVVEVRWSRSVPTGSRAARAQVVPSVEALDVLVSGLPAAFRPPGVGSPSAGALRRQEDAQVALLAAVRSRVATSSRQQTLKGLITGGLMKSAGYLAAKLAKRWR